MQKVHCISKTRLYSCQNVFKNSICLYTNGEKFHLN